MPNSTVCRSFDFDAVPVRLAVNDEPFEWELEGNCAFVSTFSYSG